jgi:phospholipid-binding lipoprotein MlaA
MIPEAERVAMSGLALLASSPALLNAVIAASTPATAPPQQVIPLAWTLAKAGYEPPPAPSGQEQGPPAPPPQPAPDDDQPLTEIIVQGSYGPPAIDPAEAVNEFSYGISSAVDQVLVQPVTYAYRDVVPEPIRDGLGNVVRNFGEPGNALNFLLQGKVGKALGVLGRIAINTTIGIGGLIDVAAKPGIGIPYRRNGFANTMGFYGIGPGPYLFVPITGPTTLRDQIGVTLDQALLPTLVGNPFNRPEYGIFYFAVNSLDSRLRDDGEIAKIKASDDPYVARRDSYLARRRREIAELRGDPIPEPYEFRISTQLPESVPKSEAKATKPQSHLMLPVGLKRGPSAGDGGR